MRASKRRVSPCLVAGAIVLTLPACFNTRVAPVKLGVPYRTQAADFYCGVASTLMWRLYDGLPDISQSVIASYENLMNGVDPEAIARGVNHFTATWDAYVDYPSGVGDPTTLTGQFFSRQITSIDTGVPVIGVLSGGLHAGVLDGGGWHYNNDSGLYVWDYVYFHDPDPFIGGPDVYRSAYQWTGGLCTAQVISDWASWTGNANFSTYGDSLGVHGRTGWPPQA